MKKAKKLGLQSLALVLMAFVLVAGVAFGMTGAWFTDKVSKDTGVLTFDNNVIIDAPTIIESYTGKRYDSTTDSVIAATITKAEVMPGDVIGLTFNIAKAAGSIDFKAKLEINVTYGGSAMDYSDDMFTYTQKVDNTAYTNNAVLDVGASKAVAIGITLNGEFFKNSDAEKVINVSIKIDAIQAANYNEANWTNNAAGTGREKIVEYTVDFDTTNAA